MLPEAIKDLPKDLVLLQSIQKLHSQIAYPCDSLDIGITLSKMTDEQLDDLSAMVQWMKDNNNDCSYILAQVVHDLNGLKAGFLGLPEGIGFCPRSSGYDKKLETD